MLLRSCQQYTKEVLHAHNFFYEQFSSGMCDTFAISGIYDTIETLLTFHQKSYNITVQSNFLSAQAAQ